MIKREIITWSKCLPQWQQTILSHLFRGIPANELYEYALDLVLGQYNISDCDEKQEITCKNFNHSTEEAKNHHVTICSIENVRGISTIIDDSSLTFKETGLTIIYGENASGKTSFSRILKKFCRYKGDIPDSLTLGNVFNPTSTLEATINYKVGEDSKSCSLDDVSNCEDLYKVNIYDNKSINAFISRQNEIEYLPFGLDKLHWLVIICDRVATLLSDKKSKIDSTLPEMPSDLENTDVMTKLKSIDISTTDDEITNLCSFTATDVENKEKFESILQESDPKSKIELLKTQLTILNQIHTKALAISRLINDNFIRAYNHTIQEVHLLEELVEKSKAQAFSDSDLPGTGSKAWQELLFSAEHFSYHYAYKNLDYPSDEGIDKCVLCQQPISSSAKKRMNRFHNFVSSSLSGEISAKHSELLKLSKTITDIDIGILEQSASLVNNENVSTEVLKTSSLLQSLKTIAQNYLNENICTPLPEAKFTIEAITVALDNTSSLLAHLEASLDASECKTMENELRNLKAKQILNARKDKVIEAVHNKRALHFLEEATSSTKTNKITSALNELSTIHTTTALIKSFSKWANLLCPASIKVAIEKARPTKGKVYYKIALQNINSSASIKDIASESELKAVTIAAFLAELEATSNTSTIIFDDPMSSFDHKRRRSMAEALGGLSTAQQIIVFTHDIHFMLLLNEETKNNNQLLMLLRKNQNCGVVIDDLPLEILCYKKRCGRIRDIIQQSETDFRKGHLDIYYALNISLVRHLRMAAERCFEEVLFCGVVKRYNHRLLTNIDLSKLTTICERDIMILKYTIGKYSSYLHDQPFEASPSVPDIDEIKNDFEELDKWVTEYSNRKA